MLQAIPIFYFLVILFSISIHEVSHGLAALSEGDPTAKLEKRLTLNPLAHIDPIGTVLVPLFLFVFTLGQGPIIGWAKPVPVNPFFFKNPRKGILKVSLAGPMSNFIIGIFFSIFSRFLLPSSNLIYPFRIISIYNFLLCFFNLLPIPPLDGHYLLFHFLPTKLSFLKAFLFQYYLFFLLIVVFFISPLLFRLSVGFYSFFANFP